MNSSSKIFYNILATAKVMLGAFLMALSIHSFTIPAKFIPGGVSGIASMLQILTSFPASYSVFIINFPLVLLSFLKMNKTFALKSLGGIVLTSTTLFLFSQFDFFTYQNPLNPLIPAIAGGILSGVGVGLLVSSEFYPGGTEIAGAMLQKKHTAMSMSWIIFAINCIVITVGSFLYRFVGDMSTNQIITIVVCSFIQIFFNSKSMDIVLNGGSYAVKFEVITDKTTELTHAISSQLGRTVTIMSGQGGYSQEKSDVLVCVITRTQISAFKRILKETDPNAFAFAINTREVLGRGFRKVK